MLQYFEQYTYTDTIADGQLLHTALQNACQPSHLTPTQLATYTSKGVR